MGTHDDKNNIVVTIGRQFGSGGRLVGRKLAEMLGFDYYDKELLAQAAAEAGIGREFFEKNDEKVPSFLNGLIPFTFGMSAHAFYSGTSSISTDSLYRAQSDFIASLPGKGSCVIVGRSADHVLRHHPRLVSVFISGPVEERVKRIVERQPELSAEKARSLAEKTDKLRSAYYNFYTNKEWGAAPTYDLCLNSGAMSIDDIVATVAEYVKRRFPTAE